MGDVIWNKAGVSEYESLLAVCRLDKMNVWWGEEEVLWKKNINFLDNEQIRIYCQVVRKRVST